LFEGAQTPAGGPARGPVLDEYQRLAQVYDRRWERYVGGTARNTLARLRLRPGDRLLGVGCGTCSLLEEADRAYPGADLVGLDLSGPMPAVARRKLPPGVLLGAHDRDRDGPTMS
jgi:ubiquinone/menaquinone biosynthesis C-methylase UbiE